VLKPWCDSDTSRNLALILFTSLFNFRIPEGQNSSMFNPIQPHKEHVPARYFTWPFSSSSNSHALATQSALLSGTPHASGFVALKNNRFINTILLDSTHSSPKTLVLTHGYAAGLGFFFRNYAGLSKLLNNSGWRM
jgi:hypothetical protein